MAVSLSALPPPNAIEQISYQALLTELLTFFRSKNTDYTSVVEGDPAYTTLQGMAYAGTLIFGRINDAVKGLLITHAEGADLDILVALLGISRKTDETDSVLRERAVNHLETLALGSESWYSNHVLQSSEDVRDSRVYRKPDPNDPTQDIPGEAIVYVQGISSVRPNVVTLQAARNYINAVGANYGGDSQAEAAAIKRRFICDTVTVEPVGVLPYVICAEITVRSGLNRISVLRDVQLAAQAFVDANKRIERRIALSQIYAVLDATAVEEVRLEYPKTDIEPGKDTVPLAIAEETLEVGTYKSFGAWATFGTTTDTGWSLGENAGTWYIVFTSSISAVDKAVLDTIRECRRIGVYSLNDQGEFIEQIYRYRIENVIGRHDISGGQFHYYLELESEPDRAGLTVDETYGLRVLNSIEIRVAGGV